MRAAAVGDVWRDISKVDKYPCRLLSFKIMGVSGFRSEVNLEFNSAITAICGKNGVGKTTLMRFLFSAFRDGEVRNVHSKFEEASFEAEVINSGRICSPEEASSGGFSAYYLEPSRECTRIVECLKGTDNVGELLEGVEDNQSLNNHKIKSLIESLVGKSYSSIVFYEIEGSMPHELEYSFPYFNIVLPNGSSYTNIDMGMGELSCLYIVWFVLKFVEPQSFLFIEEPENFISAYSQSRLMDLIAAQSFGKKLWVVLSTHSEHVLSKVGIGNIKVLSQYCIDNRSAISNPKHIRKYLSALGVSSSVLGIYMVEDELARMFLEYILNKVDSDMLKDYPVIQMRCDSNIEKIVRHFEPTPRPAFEIIAVLDADQSASVRPLSGRHIYITALPSAHKLAPEIELWSVLDASAEEIAGFLDVEAERLRDAIEEYRHGDHHDRYSGMAGVCQKSKQELVNAILRKWYESEENRVLVHKFYLATKYRGRSFQVELMDDAGGWFIVNGPFFEELGGENCEVKVDSSGSASRHLHKCVGFDGADLFV